MGQFRILGLSLSLAKCAADNLGLFAVRGAGTLEVALAGGIRECAEPIRLAVLSVEAGHGITFTNVNRVCVYVNSCKPTQITPANRFKSCRGHHLTLIDLRDAFPLHDQLSVFSTLSIRILMNQQQLEKKLSSVTSELLHEKGYICFPDVFIKLGYLTQSDYENWRRKRVPCLERVIKVNLSRINFIMRTVQRTSKNGGLKPSWTG